MQRVLLIDNIDVDRRRIEQLLHTHFDVLEATTGQQGLAMYRAALPDCVFLGHRLPDIDGLKLLDVLVRERATVVLLTGPGVEDIALDAMRRGAQDCLSKTVLNEAMLERIVRYAIERKRLDQELSQSLLDLRESEKNFADLATRIDHGLWIWSADSSKCIYQNPAADRIYGRTLEQMNAIEWSDVIHPDDREAEIALGVRAVEVFQSQLDDQFPNVAHYWMSLFSFSVLPSC